MIDNFSIIIILRALFIYLLVEKGWAIRKAKGCKNKYEMYKSVRRN